MKKIKYISIYDLKARLKEIIEDVFKNKVKYIVMADKQAKAVISFLEEKGKGKVLAREFIDSGKLEEFVE